MRSSTSRSVASPLVLPFLALLLSIWIARTIPVSRASPVAVVEAREPDADHMEWKRTYFPDYPPSCQLCERDYDSIDSCANASIVFANPIEIIFDPLSFISVINCACTDTFKSAYPQCVDCFEQTNQTGFLTPENGNLSSVVTGMREICALGSTIFGHVASENSQLPGQTPITVASGAATFRRYGVAGVFVIFSQFIGWGGEGSHALVVAITTVVFGMGMGVWTVL